VPVYHTYADLDAFKGFLKDGGELATGGLGSTTDVPMLSVLEGASRAVDAFCDRSSFGSGFGPRTGTNVYDANGESYLNLRDDLITYTSGTVAPSTGASAVAVTETTDGYFDSGTGIYATPYRRFRLHLLTSKPVGVGYRIWSFLGKWGYQDERSTSTTTVSSGLAVDATATTFTTSATPTIAIGHTLLIGSEQLYVTGLASTTATVVRGVNGTTAAVHANSSAIDVYRYPREVRNATLLIAQRRWRARQSGVGGFVEGTGIGGGALPPSEMTILRQTVGHLRIYGVG
jgi:hypothetical protein